MKTDRFQIKKCILIDYQQWSSARVLLDACNSGKVYGIQIKITRNLIEITLTL